MCVGSLRSTEVRVCIVVLLQAQGAQQSACGFIEEQKSMCTYCGAFAGTRSTAKCVGSLRSTKVRVCIATLLQAQRAQQSTCVN